MVQASLTRHIASKETLIFLCALAFAAVIFSPALQYGFTNWDDDMLVTNNAANFY